MNALDVLDKVEATTGKNNKVSILADFKDDPELKFLLNAALNFKHKFNVKKFNNNLGEHDHRYDEAFDHLQGLLADLETRAITGNAAVEAVESFLKLCNLQQRKWYSRVIRKDLRSGFDISTANKAGFNIPKFDVMLATDAKKCKKVEQIVKEGVYVSPKLDGYRCLAIVDENGVGLYSRNGSSYENFPSIVGALTELAQEVQAPFILDGEIMSDDFQSMQKSAFASKRGTTVGDVQFCVFGWIPYEEWQADKFTKLTNHRIQSLNVFFETFKIPQSIVQVEHTLVHNLQEVYRLESDYIAQGYEGAMALPNIPYYLGRKSNKLIKFKTMHSMDCEVVGIYEGTGKNEGRMGGLNLIQENGEKCDVGTGFSDEDRDWMWANKDNVIGRIAEIKYQEMTNDNIMRFPIFLRWRDKGDGNGKI